MKQRAKLRTSDEDNITIILLNKEYNDYQDSINDNVYFYDGDRSETKWCLIQYDKDGAIEWWSSDEIELIDQDYITYNRIFN